MKVPRSMGRFADVCNHTTAAALSFTKQKCSITSNGLLVFYISCYSGPSDKICSRAFSAKRRFLYIVPFGGTAEERSTLVRGSRQPAITRPTLGPPPRTFRIYRTCPCERANRSVAVPCTKHTSPIIIFPRNALKHASASCAHRKPPSAPPRS